MYKLENNVEWTEDLKNAFKHGITRGKIKYTNDNNQEVVIDYDNGLKKFKLYDEKNVPSQGFIGQATARQVDLELINTININNLENKEFELFLGADYLTSSEPYADLPEEYQQVEYIESTGTQYINPEINPSNKKIEFDIKYSLTETTNELKAVFGSQKTDNVDIYRFSTYQGKWRFKIANIAASVGQVDTLVHTLIFNGKNGTYFDGNIVQNLSNQITIPNTNNKKIVLFANNVNENILHYSKSRIYYCKIYDDNNLVRNLIPCYKKVNNEIGLYDLVNGVFYTNEGTGTFSKGNDVIRTYYIKYGKFIVNQAPENDLTNGTIKITAFDYMIKANIPYVPIVTFPCTLKAVVDDICLQTGLELATLDFANSNFIVDSNQFDGKTCREVLCHVGKCAFSWVRIGQDNKLYIDYEIKDLLDFKLNEIDGDTFQQSYTGSNILHLKKGTYSNNGIQAIVENNNITITGTSTAQSLITIELLDMISADGTTLTKSLNPFGTYTGLQTSLRGINPANTAGMWSTNASNFSGILSADAYYFRIQVDSGISINATLKAQLEVGSTATSFEPYTNGPSPNPDYPQDIQVVTGNNNILVNNGNLGNMTALYKDMYAFNPNYVRQETIDNKKCIVFHNNRFRSADGFRGLQGRYKENTQYKLNVDLRVYDTSITSGRSLSTYFFYVDGTSKRVNIPANGSNWDSIELISDVNKTINYISFSYGDNARWCLANLSIIEYNSQETYEYKESQEQNFPISLGNIELCKTGDYQDKIIKKYDGWYKAMNVRHLSFAIANMDYASESYPGWNIDQDNPLMIEYPNLNNAISTVTSTLNNISAPNFIYANTRTGKVILPKNKFGLTKEQWQSQYPNLVLELYYGMPNTEYIKITDTTLINQLNALYNAKLYEGKNYIIPQAEANNLIGTYIFNTSKSSLTIADVTSIDTTTYDMADKITIEDYYQDKFKTANEIYGAINRVVYADSNIQGQEEKVEDTDDIAINGVHELTIYDNYFAYTTEKRQQLIQAGTRLFGMKYMPIQQLEMVGLAYLDCNDILEATSPDNNKFPILPLNHIIEYNGAVKDSLTLETNSTTETNYKNTNAPINANSLTEIIVDRAMREIKMIVDQYVNFLHNKSGNNNIFIDGTRDGEGFITKFVIKGSTTYFTQNSITIVISEGTKNEETTLLTEDSDTLLTESSDVLLGESKTLYIASKNIVLDAPLRNLIVNEVNHYDEIQILQDGTIQIIRRIGVSQNQTLYLLDEEEITILEDKFVIPSKENGLYYFIEELNNLDYYAEYIIKNEYSDVYATEAYVNAGLDLKVDTNRLVSELNASADIIKLIGQRLIILMQNYSLDEEGYMTALKGEIAGFLFNNNQFSKDFDMLYEFTKQDVLLLAGAINSYNTLTSGIHDLYNVYGASALTVQDLVTMIQIMNGAVENTKKISGTISIKSNNCNELIEITNTSNIPKTRFGVFSIYSYLLSADVVSLVDEIDNSVVVKGIVLDRAKRQISVTDYLNETHITTTILPTGITTPTLTQTSRADDKKDFEKMEDALEEVMNTDIYTYHLKSQNDDDKKHVGFVIGEGFKYSHLITAENDKKEEIGVDPYSMVSVLWKAVQEQQIQIEELKKEIKKLKGE